VALYAPPAGRGREIPVQDAHLAPASPPRRPPIPLDGDMPLDADTPLDSDTPLEPTMPLQATMETESDIGLGALY
jgi:hypothetical protein